MVFTLPIQPTKMINNRGKKLEKRIIQNGSSQRTGDSGNSNGNIRTGKSLNLYS